MLVPSQFYRDTSNALYIQQRGSVFQFVMRVPSDLIPRAGKKFVRMSLKTRDPQEAIKRAEPLALKTMQDWLEKAKVAV